MDRDLLERLVVAMETLAEAQTKLAERPVASGWKKQDAKPAPKWRDSYEVYVDYAREGYSAVIGDHALMAQIAAKTHPDHPAIHADAKKSVDKLFKTFLSTEAQWEYKKKAEKFPQITWKNNAEYWLLKREDNGNIVWQSEGQEDPIRAQHTIYS